VELADTHGLLEAGMRAHCNLGVASSWLLSDLAAAVQGYRRAAELAGQAGDVLGQIAMLTNLTDALTMCGDFKEAETTLSRARSLRDDLPEPDVVAGTLFDAEADYLVFSGEWLAAARIRRVQVGAARERGDDFSLANNGFRLAWAVLESRLMGVDVAAGEWQEAEAALAEAIEIFDRADYQVRCVDNRLYMGAFRVIQGRLDDGRQLLAEAREKGPKQPSDLLEARVQMLVAQLAAAEGRWAEALAAIEASTAIADRLGRRWDWARRLLDWAAVHAARDEPGDWDRARELLREAQVAFEEMGVPRYAQVAAGRLRILEEGEGQRA
jgi:tetratricopeptide (TPR) repeat protein